MKEFIANCRLDWVKICLFFADWRIACIWQEMKELDMKLKLRHARETCGPMFTDNQGSVMAGRKAKLAASHNSYLAKMQSLSRREIELESKVKAQLKSILKG